MQSVIIIRNLSDGLEDVLRKLREGKFGQCIVII